MCAVIFVIVGKQGVLLAGRGYRDCPFPYKEGRGPNQREALAWIKHFHQGETGPPAPGSCGPVTVSPHLGKSPPTPSLSVSSSLAPTPPVPLASRRPSATQLPVPLPLGSCPPFHPLPRRGCGPPVRQESAGGCTRLQRPSCPLHSACLATDWPSCCFHGDHRQSPAPTFHLLPRPPRPYSVARAATSRLIKQEPREEPGCGPRSQRGGLPRGEMGGGGGE